MYRRLAQQQLADLLAEFPAASAARLLAAQ
jgi:hypothetical protein